ncbi:cytochrome c oxidase accessory protein CcoG [Pseudoduganella sp. FT93W]|uniref:Cytochrome c oxidase accessory protein CcoG n=1 Tax=Duganella fentianensis TaxID=2692177 RepID=A0A845HUU4_9BURK|nr:cytochrome c oxidase accessory protein CcoG [Duganella fentianensis]MYN44840.1 cytochrome c oxidase accessory protein CcoG [Duganella fentianensis]
MSQTSPDVAVIRMYAPREQIYAREARGRFASWRWLCVWLTQAVFYGLPWLHWNGRQAVLFDLGARKFYLWGLVLWPQDLIYLAALLIVCALSLFLFTAVAGRVWCGFACPQTVYTEIFMWIERQFEGERSARIRLDRQPWGYTKLARKGGKHLAWLLFALWTGFTFVAYFTPLPTLAASTLSFALGPWESFWVLFYSLATYGNAGWMREQVCRYMCPYARFQSSMFDQDTLIVSYDARRGEPRAPLGKQAQAGKAMAAAASAQAGGGCIDCSLCVQVCPTGIDIRNGLQYDCISCAACVDACDSVMDKIGAPRGLVAFTTSRAVQQQLAPQSLASRLLRPRVLVYVALLALITAALGWTMLHRSPLKLDVIRDRGVMAREVEQGQIENSFRLQLMHVEEQTRRYRISVHGLEGLTLTSPAEVRLEPASTRFVPVTVRLAAGQGQPGANRISFRLVAIDADGAPVQVEEKAMFFIPRS